MAEAAIGLMAGIEFTLLGTRLKAGVLRNGEGTRLYIHQDAEAPNEGVTIEQLINDVRTLLNKKEGESVEGLDKASISQQLEAGASGPFTPEKVRLKLHTVYLDIFTPTSGTATYEFAFRVDVDCEDLVPKDIQLIKAHSLTLAIWKTNNAAIKKQLQIPDQLALSSK